MEIKESRGGNFKVVMTHEEAHPMFRELMGKVSSLHKKVIWKEVPMAYLASGAIYSLAKGKFGWALGLGTAAVGLREWASWNRYDIDEALRDVGSKVQIDTIHDPYSVDPTGKRAEIIKKMKDYLSPNMRTMPGGGKREIYFRVSKKKVVFSTKPFWFRGFRHRGSIENLPAARLPMA